MAEFSQLAEVMIQGAAEGMAHLASAIMDDSLEQVPRETGALAESADIEDVVSYGAMVSVTFGYGYGDVINPDTGKFVGDYDVPVHEKTEVYHEPPTKAKFLEDPVLEHANKMKETLLAYMELAMLRGGQTVTVATAELVNGEFVHQETLEREVLRQERGQ